MTMNPPYHSLTAALCLAPALAFATPDPLSWQNYESLKSHIAPKKEDFAFKKVNWHMDLPNAISVATEADKPLLLWLYFGNPQGNC